MPKYLAACAAALALLVATPAAADPGAPSQTWVPDGRVDAVAISGSTAYIGGSFGRIGPYTGGSVSLDPVSGQRRSSWPDVSGALYAAVADGGGGWYLGGAFTAVGGVPRRNLAHVLADGTIDAAWAPSPDGPVFDLLLRGGARLYAGGNFKTIGGVPRSSLAELDAASGAPTGFTAGVSGSSALVRTLALGGTKADPILYAGGSFAEANGVARGNLASFLAGNGSVTGFDPSVAGDVSDIELADGRLFAAGHFVKVNKTVDRTATAAFDATSGAVAAWDPKIAGGTAAYVLALQVVDSTVYAGGSFLTVNDNTNSETQRAGAASFDATTATVTSWNPKLNGPAEALAVVGQTAYLGGAFSTVNGSVSRSGLAAVAADSGLVRPWDPSPHGPVATLVAGAAEVIAGGRFEAIGGVARRNLAAIDLSTGQPTAFDPNVSGAVHAVAVGAAGVWAGGDFTFVNGLTPRLRLANLDPATGQVRAFSQAIDAPVRALALAGSTIYAGGDFTTINTTTIRHRIAAFGDAPGTSGTVLPFDAAASGPVTALALAGATLYLGGDFATINAGSVGRRNLAAVDATTGTATAWRPDADGRVRALLALGGTVVAGGDFATVNGATPRRGVAMLDATTGAATAWNAGVDGSVDALASDGLQIFAGGSFTQAGGSPRTSLAAFDTIAGTPAPWSPNLVSHVGEVPFVGALAATPHGWLTAGGVFALDRDPVRSAGLAAFALPPAASGPSDRTAPRLSRLTVSRKRFRVGRLPRRGTRVSFTLSEPARVSFGVLAVGKGRRTAKGCRKAGGGNRKRKPCRLLTRKGGFTRSAPAGRSRVAFTGRLGRRALKRRAYVIRATPTDAAGNRGAARSVRVRIVR